MAYYLGRDVAVAITTEDAGVGVDVTAAGVLGTFVTNDGTSDTVFAGPRTKLNNANSPNTNFSDVSTTVFGTQGEGVTADFSNEVSDLTACDIGIGASDEDVSYLGKKTTLKVEVKKETSVSLTRKKSNNCWEKVFYGARHGVESHPDSFLGNVNPARSDYGYRVFVKLRDQSEVFTLNNCCITGHTISLNVDGTTEETLEFMGYTTPVITAGTSGTDHVADTTVF